MANYTDYNGATLVYDDGSGPSVWTLREATPSERETAVCEDCNRKAKDVDMPFWFNSEEASGMNLWSCHTCIQWAHTGDRYSTVTLRGEE